MVALWFFAGNKTMAPNYVEHVRDLSLAEAEKGKRLLRQIEIYSYGRLNKYRFSIQ